jgi:hypothetical protein
LAAAYFGWGQGVDSARHLYLALMFLMVAAQASVFLVTLLYIAMSEEMWAKLKAPPKPIEMHFTLGFSLTSLALKLMVLAWFGALWVGIAVFLLGVTSRLIGEFHNVAIAKRISP